MPDYPVIARRIDSHGADATGMGARRVLLHRNLQEYGTIINMLAGATAFVGPIRRKDT